MSASPAAHMRRGRTARDRARRSPLPRDTPHARSLRDCKALPRPRPRPAPPLPPSARALASTALRQRIRPEPVLRDVGDVEHPAWRSAARSAPSPEASSGLHSMVRRDRPCARCSYARVVSATRARACLSPALAAFVARSLARSTCSRSASCSSVSIVSMSSIGESRPETWATSSDSKQRTTCAIARVFAHACQKPVFRGLPPSTPPATSPAMSTNSSVAGTTRSGPTNLRDSAQTRIGHRDDADIRLDGAERIVLRRGRGAGQCVVQGGLADVRQPDDAALDAHSPRSRPLRKVRWADPFRAAGEGAQAVWPGANPRSCTAGESCSTALDSRRSVSESGHHSSACERGAPVQRIHCAFPDPPPTMRGDVVNDPFDGVVDLGAFRPATADPGRSRRPAPCTPGGPTPMRMRLNSGPGSRGTMSRNPLCPPWPPPPLQAHAPPPEGRFRRGAMRIRSTGTL